MFRMTTLLINSLKINGNAIILMDSDRKKKNVALKPRVLRVSEEVKKMNGIVWVTAGKEVENYIPRDALRSVLKSENYVVKYVHVDFIEAINKKKKGNFKKRKSELAARVRKVLTKQMLSSLMNLASRLAEICLTIKKWNNRLGK